MKSCLPLEALTPRFAYYTLATLRLASLHPNRSLVLRASRSEEASRVTVTAISIELLQFAGRSIIGLKYKFSRIKVQFK